MKKTKDSEKKPQPQQKSPLEGFALSVLKINEALYRKGMEAGK